MRMDEIAATAPAAEAAFVCSRGHGFAGRVSLHRGDPDDWVAVVDSFVCRETTRVSADAASTVRAALTGHDAAALHRVDLELAPFYCPECAVVYCGQCWRQELVFDDGAPGWLEETRGTCPEGHIRMLVD